MRGFEGHFIAYGNEHGPSHVVPMKRVNSSDQARLPAPIKRVHRSKPWQKLQTSAGT